MRRRWASLIAFLMLFCLSQVAYGADCPTLPGCPDCGHLYWHPEEAESTWLWVQGNSPVSQAKNPYFQASWGFISIFWPPNHPEVPQPARPEDFMILDCAWEPWSLQTICTWIEGHLFHAAPYPEGVITLWANDPYSTGNYLGILNFVGGVGMFAYNENGSYVEAGGMVLFSRMPLAEWQLDSILWYTIIYGGLRIADMPNP